MPKLDDPFRVLFELNPVPMWVFDTVSLAFLEVNEAAIQLYGYSREEFLRMTLRDIRPPEDVPHLEETLAKLTADTVMLPAGEWRHWKRDGTLIYVEVCAEAVKFEGRDARLSMMMDVTERKLNEHALRRSETCLNEAQHVAALGSWEWNIAEGTSSRSDELYRLFGYPPQGVRFDIDDIVRVVHPEDRDKMRKLLEDVVANPHNFEVMFRVVLPDGSVRQLHGRGEVTRDAGGRPLKMTGTAQDATERQQAEQQRMRNARLQAANKELEAFSYTVSHDLRTPLRSIDAFAKLLAEEYGAQLDETGRTYLDLILTGTRRMNELIEDLIEFSRVTSTKLERTEMDMSTLVQGIARELQRTGPERNIEWRIEPGLKAHADYRLMRIALENLLGNAWKFTGKTEKAVIEFGAQHEGKRTIFFVRDNGAGFDMEFAGKLFGVFQRLHSESEFSGTGIGLAIVKRVIARHGGRIWAQGAVGSGASFYFTLPEQARVQLPGPIAGNTTPG